MSHESVNSPHRASLLGRLIDLEFLLAIGHAPNSLDEHGDTPLHAGVVAGNPEVVRTLLGRGADPNARGGTGIPVLHLAAAFGRGKAVSLLLQAGADASVRSGDGFTALQVASLCGHHDVVLALTRHDGGRAGAAGAPATSGAAGATGATDVLQWLARNGAHHLLRQVLSGSGIDALEQWLRRGASPGVAVADGESLLACAAAQGHPQSLRALLAAGANPDGEPWDRAPPLARAVEAGRWQAVALLLEAGADPDRADRSGRVRLEVYERLWSDGPERRRVGDPLLSHGARATPQWAVLQGDSELLLASLRSGFPVDRRDAGGLTALHHAIRAQRVDLVETLLAYGADPGAPGPDGATPLHLASRPSLTWFGEGEPRLRIVRRLLLAGADPNRRDRDGRTPLHWALHEVHTEGVDFDVVERLLASGADPNARDHQGLRPIECGPYFSHVGPDEDQEDRVERRVQAVDRAKDLLARGWARGSGRLGDSS